MENEILVVNDRLKESLENSDRRSKIKMFIECKAILKNAPAGTNKLAIGIDKTQHICKLLTELAALRDRVAKVNDKIDNTFVFHLKYKGLVMWTKFFQKIPQNLLSLSQVAILSSNHCPRVSFERAFSNKKT